MPSAKARSVRLFQKYVLNPPVRALFALGLVPPTHVLLETTGRKTGRPRQNPVGNGLDGDTLWIVAEHGRGASYVRNLEADPKVRVKIGRRWRTGTATVLPDDDPRARLERIGRPVNGFMVRAVGTDLLTIRVDLDPAGTG
ncbi:MAG TPA: nitroreductase/quinone reductase family protein [Acidimicrobiia bacterium]|nr:nitroreductase/quinone reductase family protein [Acidimicrobiia bacterium]